MGVSAPIQDGEITSAKLAAAAVKAPKLDGNQNGAAPIFAPRAWVRFNGTGTPAIAGSGNVSSITDNGTGDYSINFNTAMNSGNYGVAGSCSQGGIVSISTTTAPTTAAVRIRTLSDAGTGTDYANVSVWVIQ